MLNLMKILITMNDHDRDIPFDHHDKDHRDDSDDCEEGTLTIILLERNGKDPFSNTCKRTPRAHTSMAGPL